MSEQTEQTVGPHFSRMDIEALLEPSVIGTLEFHDVAPTEDHSRRLLRALVGLGVKLYLEHGGSVGKVVVQLTQALRTALLERKRGPMPQQELHINMPTGEA